MTTRERVPLVAHTSPVGNAQALQSPVMGAGQSLTPRQPRQLSEAASQADAPGHGSTPSCWLQLLAAHESCPLHSTPSSHVAALAVCKQPEAGSHASSVQAFPSSQPPAVQSTALSEPGPPSMPVPGGVTERESEQLDAARESERNVSVSAPRRKAEVIPDTSHQAYHQPVAVSSTPRALKA